MKLLIVLFAIIAIAIAVPHGYRRPYYGGYGGFGGGYPGGFGGEENGFFAEN